MILAAGLGKRMRPLTDRTPKPLLKVGGKALLQYHLEALSDAGIREVIINTAYRGEQIEQFAGDGRAFGLSIRYSREPEPLETGGAIYQALPLLGEAPFLMVNADVWTDYPLQALSRPPLEAESQGRLLLVPNPDFHPEGDFALTPEYRLSRADEPSSSHAPRYTFAGISLLRPELIAGYPHRRAVFPLLEALLPAMDKGQLEGRVHEGRWSDIGTPERLIQMDELLTATGS